MEVIMHPLEGLIQEIRETEANYLEFPWIHQQFQKYIQMLEERLSEIYGMSPQGLGLDPNVG